MTFCFADADAGTDRYDNAADADAGADKYHDAADVDAGTVGCHGAADETGFSSRVVSFDSGSTRFRSSRWVNPWDVLLKSMNGHRLKSVSPCNQSCVQRGTIFDLEGQCQNT